MQFLTDNLLNQLDELHVSLCQINQMSKVIKAGQTASPSEALVAFEKVEATLKDILEAQSVKKPTSYLRLVSSSSN